MILDQLTWFLPILLNTFLIMWGLCPVPSRIPDSHLRTFYSCAFLLFLRIVSIPLVNFLPLPWLGPPLKLLTAIPVLIFWKGVTLSQAWYATFYLLVSFTAADNIFSTPSLSGIIDGQFPFTTQVLTNYFISLLITAVLHFIIITAVTRLISFERISKISLRHFLLMIFVMACDLYIVYTLSILDTYELPQLTIYLSVLQLFILGGLVLFDKYQRSSAKAHQMELDRLTNRYRLAAAQSRLSSESEIRQLHHDIKNHLLALYRLKDDPTGIEHYISGLMDQFIHYESLIRTGNPLLDGLLGDKAEAAKALNIHFEVTLDLSPCNYLDGIDICTIFGNAVDNAIEACRLVEGPRLITIRSRISAAHCIVTLSNPYTGTLHYSGGRLLTTKSDSANHGNGLNGIRRTMGKYGAEFVTDTETPGVFSLYLFFPLHCQPDITDPH